MLNFVYRRIKSLLLAELQNNIQGGDFYVNIIKRTSKRIIKGNNFQSVADVSAYLKDIFKDISKSFSKQNLRLN